LAAPVLGLAGATSSACALVTSFDGFGGGSSADGGPQADGQTDAEADALGAIDGQTGGGDAPGDSAVISDTGGAESATSDAAGAPDQDAGAAGDAQGSDAPSDALGGADTPGSGPLFCTSIAPLVKFCADFDEGSPTTGWLDGTMQAHVVTAYNTAAIATDTAASPPASLHAVTGLTATYADVELDLSNAPSQMLHADLDVYPDNNQTAAIVEIDFCTGPCNGMPPYDFEVLINDNGSACIGERGNGCSLNLMQTGTLPPQRWAHVSLSANMSTGAVSLAVGGLPTIQGSLSATQTSPTPLLIFAVGVPYPTPGAVHVDNVVFDAR
jgi:hypothetical protein